MENEASPELAAAVAATYASWTETGVLAAPELFSPEFLDNVSGLRGHRIFDIVAAWLEQSFADRRVELHAVMRDGDRIMIWFTMHGTHVGNGFPRLAGMPVAGATVSWSQIHVFRVRSREVIEHWAVRDDFGMLEQLRTDA